MDKKISSTRAYQYLVKKCNGKTKGDLQRLTNYMKKMLSNGSLKLDELEFNGANYIALIVGYYDKRMKENYEEGCLFRVEDDKLNYIGSSDFASSSLTAKDLLAGLDKDFKSKKDADDAQAKADLEAQQKAAQDKAAKDAADKEAADKAKQNEVHERGGIKYNILSSSSRGSYNSRYGSDSLTIKVLDDTPVEKVKKVFDDPLADFVSRGDGVYSITYYRD